MFCRRLSLSESSSSSTSPTTTGTETHPPHPHSLTTVTNLTTDQEISTGECLLQRWATNPRSTWSENCVWQICFFSNIPVACVVVLESILIHFIFPTDYLSLVQVLTLWVREKLPCHLGMLAGTLPMPPRWGHYKIRQTTREKVRLTSCACVYWNDRASCVSVCRGVACRDCFPGTKELTRFTYRHFETFQQLPVRH